MKAKRKGPRYVPNTSDSWAGFPVMDTKNTNWHEGITCPEVCRLLNAGERAKAEVKRLRTELKALRERYNPRNKCPRCDGLGHICHSAWETEGCDVCEGSGRVKR